jgi:hypothetical protein
MQLQQTDPENPQPACIWINKLQAGVLNDFQDREKNTQGHRNKLHRVYEVKFGLLALTISKWRQVEVGLNNRSSCHVLTVWAMRLRLGSFFFLYFFNSFQTLLIIQTLFFYLEPHSKHLEKSDNRLLICNVVDEIERGLRGLSSAWSWSFSYFLVTFHFSLLQNSGNTKVLSWF